MRLSGAYGEPGILSITAERSGWSRDSRAGSSWDEAEFERLFLDHYSRVLGVLQRLVGDSGRAEELAMDVFARLYRQPLPPDREHNIAGWLYRTATRAGIDALRASARRQRYEELAVLDAATGRDHDTPLDAMLRDEECRRVRAALGELKPAQAQILMLRGCGFSYKELAAVVCVKPSSIGTLLARAEAAFESKYRNLMVREQK